MSVVIAGLLRLTAHNFTSSLLISQIKNIRFTYQFCFAIMHRSGKSGGSIGGAQSALGLVFPPIFQRLGEAVMPAITSLTYGAAKLAARAAAAMVVSLGRAVNRVVRTIRNRRDAARLARFDDRMLADIGLTRG